MRKEGDEIKRSEITKREILKAAEEKFASKGLYGARVDEIAECAQINKRMIYAYFGSKEQLYTEVLKVVYNRLAEREKLLLSDDSDCVQAIRNIISMYFEFLQGDPHFVKLIMWENLNEARYIQDSGAVVMKDYALRAARRVLEKGIRLGVFKGNIDIEEFILSLNMFAFSYFSNIYTMAELMQIDFHQPQQIKKRADYVTQILLDYIKK
ncbi:MAG: TetR/AcrR family transcriptional regulator [Acetanaerobacterium sp.]